MDDDPRLIREALSVPGDAFRGNISRRRFLQGAIVTAGVVAVLPACIPSGGSLDQGILIVLHFGGGNDGYNTVVPLADAAYQAKRGTLAVTNPIPVSPNFGFHPSLPKLAARHGAGKVAVVHGVGQSTVSDLSHFSSTASWMAGTAGPGRSNGWLGRWLDGVPGSTGGLRAVAMGTSVPLHLLGQQAVVTALGTNGSLPGADRSNPSDSSIYDAISGFASGPTGKGVWADQVATAGGDAMALASSLAPTLTPAVPDDSLVSQLTIIARLINANLGIRVFDATMGSFDTHDKQAYEHPALLTELDDAIDAFYATLAPSWASKVAMMSFSEFGRRAQANASGGTDHGTSSCLFVIGDNVKGGFYGQFPALDDLDSRGNPKVFVDYRSVYSSVLQGWIGGDARGVLGADYPNLGLFSRLPGATG